MHAKELNKEETMWIKEKMNHHKTVEKSFELALKLSNEAKLAMSEDKELVSILDTMIKRSF